MVQSSQGYGLVLNPTTYKKKQAWLKLDFWRHAGGSDEEMVDKDVTKEDHQGEANQTYVPQAMVELG